MKTVIIFALMAYAAIAATAQTPQGSPPPPPPSATPPPQTPPVGVQPVRRSSVDMRRLQNFPLNPVSESDRLAARVVALQRIVAPMYRKPSEKEAAALAVSAANLQRYSEFLKAENVGIVRLVPDTGCEYSERVISAREDCIKYSIPGSGNSFSFRSESYRLRHLADITYMDGKLRITGIFMHGLVTELGDVPIERVAIDLAAMRPLTGFRPSTSVEDVVQVDLLIDRGLTDGTFKYSKEVVPKADSTYAIRVVAYRGKVVRSAAGVRYNELDYDKRRDAIVVFRIVELDAERGITIVWRKLSDVESPRIKVPDRGEAGVTAGGKL